MSYQNGKINEVLSKIEFILGDNINHETVRAVLQSMGISFTSDIISEMKIFCDYCPGSESSGITDEERYLHFLWDAVDRYPLSLAANFACPYRQMIAGRLFKSCGRNLCSESDVRFSVGSNISAGDDVFIGRGAWLDAKGVITLGNYTEICEFSKIFTYSTGENLRMEIICRPVNVEDYAKISAASVILPGVTVGEGAVVLEGSVVTGDVKPWTVVAGNPAIFLRNREETVVSGEIRGNTRFYGDKFRKKERAGLMIKPL